MEGVRGGRTTASQRRNISSYRYIKKQFMEINKNILCYFNYPAFYEVCGKFASKVSRLIIWQISFIFLEIFRLTFVMAN
jgi:hypothetical protein